MWLHLENDDIHSLYSERYITRKQLDMEYETLYETNRR
jgi:hypothetical protein